MRRVLFLAISLVLQLSVYAQFNNRLLKSEIPVYHSAYQDLIDYARANAIDIPPLKIQLIQNDFFNDIDPILSKGVAGYIFAGDASRRSFAYLNIFNPGTHTVVDGVQPNFDSKGLRGNTSNMYANTTWNASTEGAGLFTQNDCSIAYYVGNDVSSAGRLDFGANDGSQQITINPRTPSPSANTLSFIVNANTNLNVSNNTISNGLYILSRTSSSEANLWKDGVQNDFTSTTSLGLPNADMYLCARNSSGTANNFSNRSIGMWMAFKGLTSDEKLLLREAWLHYYNKQQDPLFIVTDDPSVPQELIATVPATWESNQIFGIALYPNPIQDAVNEPEIIYYSGNDSSPGQGRENDVGVFYLTTPNSGSKDPGNPLLERGDIGLGGSNEGFTPMSAWVVGSEIYIFGSVYETSNSEINVGYITVPVSDPTDFSSSTLTRVITAGGTGHFNHAPHVFLDPDDPTTLLMAYAHRNVTANTIKINIAEASLSDLNSWSVRHTDIWQSSLAGSGQVYPYIIWDDVEEKYYLFCGRFSSVVGGDYFTIFSTESETLGNLSFPEGRETLWPSGSATEFDGGYTSVPRVDLKRGKIYYCGRDLSGASGSYLGIGVKNIIKGNLIWLVPIFALRRRKDDDNDYLKLAA